MCVGLRDVELGEKVETWIDKMTSAVEKYVKNKDHKKKINILLASLERIVGIDA
eukprot:COSAG01_NODE_3380_length_6171_cov_10.687582_9_plen_54_part_00